MTFLTDVRLERSGARPTMAGKMYFMQMHKSSLCYALHEHPTLSLFLQDVQT